MSEEALFTAPTVEVDTAVQTLAPWWHTALIICWFVILALIGLSTQHATENLPHWILYLSGARSQIMYLGLVVAGLYHRRKFFLDTLQNRARSWWIEITIGVVIFIFIALMFAVARVLLYRMHLHPGFNGESMQAMAPRGVLDIFLWLGLSLCVGFCEEHIFRGYLLPQVIVFGRWLGASSWLASSCAVIGTSLLFGSLHVYEGVGGAILITLLGAVYSLVALRFGNLRAVIVAHVLQDFLAGVLIMARHTHVAG
jgi:membrane protease YdiL (CAAX protease family)